MTDTGTENTKSFREDAFISFAILAANFIIASVSSILVARVLGPEGKGLYSLVFTIVGISASLLALGTPAANVYFLGGNKYEAGTLAGNALLYCALGGTAFASLLFLAAPLFSPKVIPLSQLGLLYLAIPALPLLMLSEHAYYLILARRDMRRLMRFSLVKPAVYLAALCAVFLAGASSVRAVVWANMAGIAAGMAAALYFLRSGGYFSGLSADARAFKDVLWFGLRHSLDIIFQMLNYRLDFLLVAVLLDPAQVGIYSVAVMVGETAWYIPRSFAQVLYPKTSASDKATSDQFTASVCRSTVVISAASVCALWLLSDLLIPLFFTQAFSGAVSALKFLLPGIFFLSLGKVLEGDLIGRGHPQLNSAASLAALVVTVVLDLLLIPSLGVRGASIASSAAYAADTAMLLYWFTRISGVPVTRVLVPGREDLELYVVTAKRSMRRLRGAA